MNIYENPCKSMASGFQSCLRSCLQSVYKVAYKVLTKLLTKCLQSVYNKLPQAFKIDKNEVVNEGAFQCSICNATFEETNRLRHHFSKVHGIRERPDNESEVKNKYLSYTYFIVLR